ncbi:hypothetical protein FB446DRAFT_795333 [Lentinula raphanica]|nr:hypothetical protein FB446DRAFT_795333 [Lentinula raphanica]
MKQKNGATSGQKKKTKKERVDMDESSDPEVSSTAPAANNGDDDNGEDNDDEDDDDSPIDVTEQKKAEKQKEIDKIIIINEATLSGESTPLVKEGVNLLVDELDRGVGLDVDGVHKGRVVFSGTKILQANGSSASAVADGVPEPSLKTPDGGCLGVILRTGFGTAQGQLVRTMISSMNKYRRTIWNHYFPLVSS